MKDTMKSIIEAKIWELLAEEGITKEDLNLVDLDIAFSPVIAIRGEKEPVEVTETMGGKYIVHHGLTPHAVSVEELKVMRYRYLINRQRFNF